MSEMLCLNHICVSYGSRQILHGIDLSLQPGEFCALLGLNGSGKSTLVDLECTKKSAHSFCPSCPKRPV